MRTLYVKRVLASQLYEHWGGVPTRFSLISPLSHIYVRCTKKGTINWDTTLLYSTKELIERNNVRIIT